MSKRMFAAVILLLISTSTIGAPPLLAQGLPTVPWWDDLHQVTDPVLAARLEAHGSWLDQDRVTCNGLACTVELSRTTTLPGGAPICPDVDVYALPQSRGFGGVLVGEDLFLTVHQLGIGGCLNRKVVFGYGADSAGSSLLAPLDPGETLDFLVPASDAYDCVEVLAGGSTAGWTLIRLDRPVTGRQPVKLQRFGYPEVGALVTYAGYPARLPLKIETATLTNSSATGGGSDAHVLGGSSGSMVVAPSGRTLGVAAFGNTGWWIEDPVDNCFRPDPDANSSADVGRPGGSDLDLIPARGLEISHDAQAENGLVIHHYGPLGGPFTNESVTFRVEAGPAGPEVEWAFPYYEFIGVIDIPNPPTDFRLGPGDFVEFEARADLSASFLPIGVFTDVAAFDDQTLSTLDVVYHQVHIGVDGFELECVSPSGRCDDDFLGDGPSGALAGESAPYRLTNRWGIAHTIDITAPSWLQVTTSGLSGGAVTQVTATQATLPPGGTVDLDLTVIDDGGSGTFESRVAFVSMHDGVENSRREILVRADLDRTVIDGSPDLVITPGDAFDVHLWSNKTAGVVDDADFCVRLVGEVGPGNLGEPPSLSLRGPGGITVLLGTNFGDICWSDEVFDPPPSKPVVETPGLTAFEGGSIGGTWSLLITTDPKAQWNQYILQETSLRIRPE